jgi:hypothetical protein
VLFLISSFEYVTPLFFYPVLVLMSAGDDIAKKVTLNGDEWAKLLKKARGCPANDDDDGSYVCCHFSACLTHHMYYFLPFSSVRLITGALLVGDPQTSSLAIF